ncbi:MAG: hypothetical protein OYK82_06295 [Gammaproteobacteria bacterium]|nr:hypothetical protein [Gammaproteobacteria bacterium]
MRIANVAAGGTKKHGSYGPRLLEWLRASGANRPDIVTLQKVGPTKCFPTEELGNLGYESQIIGGRHSHLGVAVISHHDLASPEVLSCGVPGTEDREARFLTVEVGGLWVSSVYVPYGPEKLGRERAIARRVEWLDRLRTHVHDERYAHRASLLCGDFNVKFKKDLKPDESRGPLYSQAEEDALTELLDLGFYDVYRRVHSDRDEKPGRTRGYAESDKTHTGGTSRLHLILASKKLVPHLRDAQLDLRTKRPRPDAPPLLAEFEGIGA